eukprot:14088876-Alexandrium_andersonii.AAC.1
MAWSCAGAGVVRGGGDGEVELYRAAVSFGGEGVGPVRVAVCGWWGGKVERGIGGGRGEADE